jgi:endonuclease/exonuclease/phosphatase family metal-dependent hydrolase
LESDLNLVSAYHEVHNIAHGAEQHATYFHLQKANDPWHIDFCFVPKQWAKRITDVTVGGDDTWSLHSDHRPVTVTLRSSATTGL